MLWPRVQGEYSDAVTQVRTLPPSSHGSCKPIDEYPSALRGSYGCGDKAGVPAANGTTSRGKLATVLQLQSDLGTNNV